MRLQPLSFHIAAGLALPLLSLAAQTPRYTAKDAVRAEWMRTPPTFSAEQITKLPPTDRARLELSLKRIGRPGAWDLLPTELSHPTQGGWDLKADEARTPRERFDALFFLNRLKEKTALKALDGLKPEDAKTWPKHLHLEAQIATARLNGGEVSAELQAFLDALQKADKVDPVRAQAARLRLVMAGKEKELLPAVDLTAGSALALLDAVNRAPWTNRKPTLEALFSWECAEKGDPVDPQLSGALGVKGMFWPTVSHWDGLRLWEGLMQRAFDGLEDSTVPLALKSATVKADSRTPLSLRVAIAGKVDQLGVDGSISVAKKLIAFRQASIDAALLPSLRKVAPNDADLLRASMLESGPIARAAAIEDLPAPPADLDTLTKSTWTDDQFESQQTLIQSYARWKMAPEEQKAQLRPWLQHPNWSCRFEAYQALKKLDPATAWPEAPKPTATEEKILGEAERLVVRGKPVRLRITFSPNFPANKKTLAEHPRVIVLKLDPTVAPINVANLELLAKKRFFDGHLVPRVVPDFVVQMGSPFDTMDGGPGYTVRCEDSLNWYGPGSVGMALAGKDTGGCQFFITTNATPHLTGKYTRVGEVENLDHAMKILDDLELGAKIESIRVVQ